MKRLSPLLQCKVNVSVVSMQFSNTAHDIRIGKCHHDQYKTILDRLIIDDPNVQNFLVKSSAAFLFLMKD